MITDDELDELGAAEVQNRLDRGDWIDASEIRTVNSWLRKAKKEQEYLRKCECAIVSSAFDAKRLSILANVIALLALVVSVISLARG